MAKKKISKKKRQQPERKSSLTLIYVGLAVIVIAAFAYYFFSNPAPDISQDIFQPEPGKVKIAEFLKFDCSHCYDLHKEMPQLLEKYGDKVDIRYIPIVWPGQSTRSIEAYIIAEQMGKGEEMRDALFQAKFVKGMDIIESFAAIENAASSIGLGDDFKSKLENGDAGKEALSNLALMRKYNVQGTPTIIIDGYLHVEPTIASIDSNISALLAK
ncbi:MAG: thioredoxin domain-containing protein [Candidatus Methanoperedens sp.]|nr:thioredoxin domain-containing protein [Candidatus Methanoperedens sp.]MCZ7360501.1 thioredoxin domain-containing protein [Candidatus Methanoperedens sp.]HLB72307.1 thioredoxin domain-containing protein [Candidatus Methanoperedens sp.]